VSAVVALPNGFPRSLVFGGLVAFIVFRRTKHDLASGVTAWKKKRLQNHIESVAGAALG
jgi:hypothetical protein